MILSKFIRVSGEDATITGWMPPVIEKIPDFNDAAIADIGVHSDFIDIDFTKKVEDNKSGLDQGFIESRDRGYDDGYKIGKHEAESLLDSELKVNVEYFKNNLAKLQKPLDTLENDIEKELAELAILIAEKMIADHIKHKPETIINLVSESIKMLPNKDRQLTININPEDLSFIKNNSESFEEFNCKFIENEKLQRGGMLIQSDDINIDLSLEKRMHDLINQFFDNN